MYTLEYFKEMSKSKIIVLVTREAERRIRNSISSGTSLEIATWEAVAQARKAVTAEDSIRFLNGEVL